MTRAVPNLTSDQEAEAFLDQDLSDLDFSQFKPVQFEVGEDGTSADVRLPASLLEAVKQRAGAMGIPYQRFIREALERAVAVED